MINTIRKTVGLLIDNSLVQVVGYVVGMVASCIVGICLVTLFKRDD
jgi:hypothetical protein